MATAITTADLTALVPDLATEDEAVLQVYLDSALDLVSESAWGTRYKRGVLYLAAHNYYASQPAGDRGAVISEKVGDLSRTYADPGSKGAGSEWDSTPWGVLYYQLRRTVAVGFAVT